MIKENINFNESAVPNTREIDLLKKTLPQFFDKNGEFLLEQFKEMLGQNDVSLNKEGYELKFLGKSYARYLSATKTETFIAPDEKHNSLPENKDSENVYIVGDNIDALKHLVGSYSGKIKCIYIDPPYNTGSGDFAYPDNFNFTVEELVEKLGIEEEEAQRTLELVGKSSHSAWLTFMYPRLVIARNLLAEDGVIFISIDYNEQANLKIACDEIFGEENFVGEIYWESKTKSQNTASSYNKLQPKAEKIFLYKRNSKNRFNLIAKGKKEYPLSDEYGIYREYPLEEMNASGVRGRESMIFDITDGVSTVSPKKGKQWQLGQDQVATYQKTGNLFIRDGKVIVKMRPEFERTEVTEPFWGFIDKTIGTAESGKGELKELMEADVFDTVKPVNLIKKLIYHATDSNDIILDFFSGSGTTAQAVMELNMEENSTRKWILVQLNQEILPNQNAYKVGYRSIDEIGRDRIQRAASRIRQKYNIVTDYGFKLYKLESIGDKTLDKLEKFNPDTWFSEDMVELFASDCSNGKSSILTTYLAMDGYGLTCSAVTYQLNTYLADKVEDSLYIIEQGLKSDDVAALIKNLECRELDINRVVLYSYSIEFNVLQELKKNLSNLQNNKHVELIERY